MPIDFARITVCDVAPPVSVIRPARRSLSNNIVSTGVSSYAAMMYFSSPSGNVKSASVPFAASVNIDPTCLMSSALWRIYSFFILASFSAICPQVLSIAAAISAPFSIAALMGFKSIGSARSISYASKILALSPPRCEYAFCLSAPTLSSAFATAPSMPSFSPPPAFAP